MHAPSVPAAPLPAAVPEFAMFTKRANTAVARMLNEFAEQRQEGMAQTPLLRWLRVRLALLALEYPEVYDTAVRDAIGQHLRALAMEDAFIASALVYAPPAEILLGLPSPRGHLAGETHQERNARLKPS